MKVKMVKFTLLYILLATLIAFALPACDSVDPQTAATMKQLGIHLKLERKKLSNGLDVILVPDHTVPIVSYQTWYRVGSVDEHPGITGISHLFEHMMFKGTPRYGQKQFFEQLEAKGAEVNAFTTRDYTVYYENFVSNLLDKVIDMESDRMANLILDENVLNSERQVVIEERKMRTENTPEGRMQEALWKLSYHYHPYQWPVIGYPEDLANLNPEIVGRYYKLHYQPKNAVVVVVGDFDPAQTFAAIQKHYGAIESLPRPERKFMSEPEQEEERRLVLFDETVSERFSQAYHVPSALDDDSYALDVLANILFEGTSSRAYRKLMDEKDICAGISGTNFTPSYPGLFIVSGMMKGKLAASLAEAELESLISEVQNNGVTQEEITRAVKQLTVQLVDNVRTPYGLGQLVGIVTTIFGSPDRYASDITKYMKVTQKDIKRVALKYLIPNNRNIITMLPAESKMTNGSSR